MKLEFPKIDISSSRPFEAESFSLGDMRVIMELLSSKIYARPKYIIVQEVSSNARDANREVGREDVPIQIKLPSRLDDNIIIADSGPGISPERMSDVFLKYGESTKRKDNTLTGGFGIGAKTPFTYTDTFNVVTITDDEDGTRRQRTYIAHKVSDGGAQMSLVDTRDSTEETGTAISFAVERKDFSDFNLAVQEVCRYWKVRPTITGVPNWNWPEETAIHSGDGWDLVSERGNAKILIDSIPYGLRMETVFGTDRSTELYKVLNHGSIRMMFKTGEIDVSATREDLDYKDRTIQAIKGRAAKCLADLRKKVNTSVSGAKSLWEASIQWHKNSHTFNQFLVKPQWKGQKLLDQSYSLSGSIYTKDIKGYKGKENYLYWRDHLKVTNFIQHGPSIITKKNYNNVDRSLRISNQTLIIVDDEQKSRPNRLRLQTIFENNPSVDVVCVVMFKTPESKLAMEHFCSWSSLPSSLISAHPKAKNARAKNGHKRTINAVKELKKGSARGAWTKQWTPCPTRAPEDGQGGLYVVLKDGKPWSNGKVYNKEGIEQIFKAIDPSLPVYGILWKYRNKVDATWVEVFDKAVEKVAELKAKPDVAVYLKYGRADQNAGLGNALNQAIKVNKGAINDPAIMTLVKNANMAYKAAADYQQYATLAERIGVAVDTPKNEFKKEKEAVLKTYPFLRRFNDMLGHYYSHTKDHTEAMKKDLIFYLNAKFAVKQAAQGVTNVPTNP